MKNIKIFSRLNLLFKEIVNLFFPCRCIICNTFATNNICNICLKKLPYKVKINYHLSDYTQIISLIEYSDQIKKILEYIKFTNDKNLAILLGTQIELLFKTIPFSEIDYWVAVPIHKKRLKKRGFNQTEVIFNEFLKKFNLSLTPLLIRSKNTPKLFKLTKYTRKNILENAFELNPVFNIKNKNIVILDDILTSGATLTEIAKLLKPAKNIYGFTFTYVPLKLK